MADYLSEMAMEAQAEAAENYGFLVSAVQVHVRNGLRFSGHRE